MARSNWESLGVDLIRNIACRLFFKDAINFSCVCKEWRFIATELSVSLSPVECPNSSQWLMFSNFHGTTFKFYNPFYNVFYEQNIPELSGAIIRCSKDGWLLVSIKFESMFFFNPFTRERIDLPDDYPSCFMLNEFCVTAPPTSVDCKVFLCYKMGNEVFVNIVCHGQESWDGYVYDEENDFDLSYSSSIFYKGEFYCLSRDGRLYVCSGKAKEEGEAIVEWDVLDKPKPITKKLIRECYLMEYDGQLLSLFVEFNGEKVFVYRLEESTMTWKRVKDLGDNMMFVSSCSSFVVKKIEDGMENKIYFPRFYDKYGVFYSLKTNKFETFNSKFSSNSLLHTEEKLHCCWIQPNFELIKDGTNKWVVKESQFPIFASS